MDTELKIPKFRATGRLVKFVREHFSGIGAKRLPADREEVFFTSKESALQIASNLVEYSLRVGPMPPRFEKLLLGHSELVVKYARQLMMRHETKLSDELADSLLGNSRELLSYARVAGRLPKHLEDSLREPRYCLSYAKDILQSRLPKHLEDVFLGDAYHTSQYALKVVRGFASALLPDSLHNFMVMKSFEDPSDEDIKQYMEAAASDPNKYQS
jgi:hypothetical protein